MESTSIRDGFVSRPLFRIVRSRARSQYAAYLPHSVFVSAFRDKCSFRYHSRLLKFNRCIHIYIKSLMIIIRISTFTDYSLVQTGRRPATGAANLGRTCKRVDCFCSQSAARLASEIRTNVLVPMCTQIKWTE